MSGFYTCIGLLSKITRFKQWWLHKPRNGVMCGRRVDLIEY